MSNKIFAGQRYIDKDGDVWQRAAYDVHCVEAVRSGGQEVSRNLVDARSQTITLPGCSFTRAQELYGPLKETDPDPKMPRPKSKSERIAELEARVAALEGQVMADKQPEPELPLTERLPVGSVLRNGEGDLAFKTRNGWRFIAGNGLTNEPLTQTNVNLINNPDSLYWTLLSKTNVVLP